jgi:predicted DNA-binding ribbon-helix-helix protein
MKRKTMTVGGVRTSIKLEPAFWEALRQLADRRGQPLSNLVNEVSDGRAHAGDNLASALRVYALQNAHEIEGGQR